MITTIVLNSDLGESFGQGKMGDAVAPVSAALYARLVENAAAIPLE
ncbi:hypothetical protein [Brenneria izbisi]|nr:hypothetical protein [Brenneria izbisi]